MSMNYGTLVADYSKIVLQWPPGAKFAASLGSETNWIPAVYVGRADRTVR